MNKNNFLSMFEGEDSLLASNVFDKLMAACKTYKTFYTDEFYPPSIWKTIIDIKDKFDINIYSYGVFEEAERRMLAFSNDDVCNFPLQLIKIINNSKFTVLKHKDYLGALMSLGIKREKIGDLIVDGNAAYVPVCKDIYQYILANLNLIGKCSCSIENVENIENENIKVSYKEMVIMVASMRLDCIVGSLCNISRSNAQKIIKSGKVLLNYFSTFNNDKIVGYDSILTIHGFGKFKIVTKIKLTSKGKIKLSVKKFV